MDSEEIVDKIISSIKKDFERIPHMISEAIKFNHLNTYNMEARELRIGSYLNLNGRIVQVDGSYIKWIEDGSYRGFEPIPLTEEWLVKVGFKERINIDEDFRTLYESPIGLVASIKKNEQIDFWTGDLYAYSVEIKYVHQLQNLYFALTGEELEIKLPL